MLGDANLRTGLLVRIENFVLDPFTEEAYRLYYDILVRVFLKLTRLEPRSTASGYKEVGYILNTNCENNLTPIHV